MESQIAMHVEMSTENYLEMMSLNTIVVNQVLSTHCKQTNNEIAVS